MRAFRLERFSTLEWVLSDHGHDGWLVGWVCLCCEFLSHCGCHRWERAELGLEWELGMKGREGKILGHGHAYSESQQLLVFLPLRQLGTRLSSRLTLKTVCEWRSQRLQSAMLWCTAAA